MKVLTGGCGEQQGFTSTSGDPAVWNAERPPCCQLPHFSFPLFFLPRFENPRDKRGGGPSLCVCEVEFG